MLLSDLTHTSSPTVSPWRPGSTARHRILTTSEDSKSKAEAERLICDANEENFRTGTIRPGNAIYGQKTDPVLGSLLQMGQSATWMSHIFQCV